MEGPEKSWNFLLGYDAGGRHNGVGTGAEICVCGHLYRVTEYLENKGKLEDCSCSIGSYHCIQCYAHIL